MLVLGSSWSCPSHEGCDGDNGKRGIFTHPWFVSHSFFADLCRASRDCAGTRDWVQVRLGCAVCSLSVSLREGFFPSPEEASAALR